MYCKDRLDIIFFKLQILFIRSILFFNILMLWWLRNISILTYWSYAINFFIFLIFLVRLSFIRSKFLLLLLLNALNSFYQLILYRGGLSCLIKRIFLSIFFYLNRGRSIIEKLFIILFFLLIYKLTIILIKYIAFIDIFRIIKGTLLIKL